MFLIVLLLEKKIDVFIEVSLYSFSLFLPTIVAGLGFTGKAAQLHTVPPYAFACLLEIIFDDSFF